MPFWTGFELPSGWKIHLAAGGAGLCRLHIASSDRDFPDPGWERDDRHPVLSAAREQLEAYFRGELRAFDVPLSLDGTGFQQRVWQELLRIPYGQTRTYLEIARSIGAPGAARAVGAANGRNPVAIIVPCHRVVNAGGGLGGYSAGLEFKRRLLEMELTNSSSLFAPSTSRATFSQ